MSRKNKDQPFNNPFTSQKAKLAKLVESKVEKPLPKKAPPPEKIEPETEEILFSRAMHGVSRLSGDPRGVLEPELPPGEASSVPFYDEDAEVYEHLISLVEGRTTFDISDSDEFIEGCVEGLDRRILSRLKRGDYSFKAHLDLHGLTRDAAREAVERFITDRRKDGQRCVLIVHGRGLNSKDNIPVLKGLLRTWLERGKVAKAVLAFATARPHDGGAGAVYVLLRR